MRILGIETSCDDTGIAIYDSENGLLANKISNQIKIHARYGGVVPELASRDHIKCIISLIDDVLLEARIKLNDIDGIAYTAGPGMIGALMVGATVGCSLAYALKIPVIPINHMEAHLLSPMIGYTCLLFPFVALLVSGGHTQLVLAKSFSQYKILGESLDDAAGEVFDKIAKLLGLSYPGGSDLSNMAQYGLPNKYRFPKPMIDKSILDFSFSGLKTHVSNVIHCCNKNFQTYANIARAFEDVMIEILVLKSCLALKKTGLKLLVIAGGVSANRVLRKKIKEMVDVLNVDLLCASPEFCTDNGAMVAYLGCVRFNYQCNSSLEIFTKSRWSIEDLI